MFTLSPAARLRALLSRARLVRMFGMGVTMQALLSGANLIVGLILIRRASDLQYSYYILATGALLLATSLQASFMQPYLVTQITRAELPARRELVGSVLRASRRWALWLCAVALVVTAGAGLLRYLNTEQALLISVSLVAAVLALGREFFRMTLFAYRRPLEVLRADLAYVGLLIGGAFAATLGAQPAMLAMGALGLAALVAAAMLRAGLWRYEPWDKAAGGTDVLKRMAVWGGWSVTGAGIHWLLIQGYSYLVAGVLDVGHVAALAATRLVLMPVFVLSGGVSMLLFPLTSRGVHESGVGVGTRRLVLLVAALAALALCYMGLMWLLRDWIFSVILKKHFEQRDLLLLLWSAVFLVTLCRDQLAMLPAARGKFRNLTLLTGVSAAVWLLASYLAVRTFGAPGAVGGILTGELVNLIGIVVMIALETRHAAASG